MPIPFILAAIGVAVSAATAGNEASKSSKNAQYQKNLSLLSSEEKKILEKKLYAAKSEEERNKLINDTLGGTAQARINALSTVQAEKEKTKKVAWIVGGIAAVLIIGGAIIVYKKRK